MKRGRPRGKVLVLGTDSRALLAVVRSLGRAGIQVHVAGERRDPITARSRYVRAIHVLDAYRESHPAWLEALAELMARLGHSTPAAAMRYQHAAQGRDRQIAKLLSNLAAGDTRK